MTSVKTRIFCIMYYVKRENYTEERPMQSPLTKSQLGIEKMEIGPSKSQAPVQLAKLCIKKFASL